MLIEPAGSTVVVTAPGESSGKSRGSKAGIAAGVVVGIIVVGAIVGGVWFYLRGRKRRALEQEYRRNATINSFAKPGSASSISDSRLEPSVMMQRRMSDGSIADNQDYSRRILKVL
jgi:cell wall integrity and stress response component